MFLGSIYELQLRGTTNGVPTLNVFHYKLDPNLTPEDAADITMTDFLQTFRDYIFRASLRHRLSAGYLVKEYYGVQIITNYSVVINDKTYIRLVYGEEQTALGAVEDKGQVDLGESDCLPSNSAVSVLFKARSRSRESRGGKRFSGIPEINQANNKLLAIPLAQFQGAATLMATPLVIGGGAQPGEFVPVIFNKTRAAKVLNGAGVFAEGYSQVIRSATARAVVSTQKSRQEAF